MHEARPLKLICTPGGTPDDRIFVIRKKPGLWRIVGNFQYSRPIKARLGEKVYSFYRDKELETEMQYMLSWAKTGEEPFEEELEPQYLFPAINLQTLRHEAEDKRNNKEAMEVAAQAALKAKEFEKKQETISKLKEAEQRLQNLRRCTPPTFGTIHNLLQQYGTIPNVPLENVEVNADDTGHDIDAPETVEEEQVRLEAEQRLIRDEIEHSWAVSSERLREEQTARLREKYRRILHPEAITRTADEIISDIEELLDRPGILGN